IHHNRRQPRLANNLAIVLRESAEVIGWIGIGPPSRAQAPDELDFGFCLRPEYWNRGLMTEAVRALLGFAFETLAAARIFAQCYPATRASARVMERAGMRLEGQRPMPGGDGEVREYRRYAIEKAMWQS